MIITMFDTGSTILQLAYLAAAFKNDNDGIEIIFVNQAEDQTLNYIDDDDYDGDGEEDTVKKENDNSPKSAYQKREADYKRLLDALASM